MQRKPNKVSKKASDLVVAVIVRSDGHPSLRHDGTWSSFVGTKAQVTSQAIEARDKYQQKGFGPYRILIGELASEIVVPTRYVEVPL